MWTASAQNECRYLRIILNMLVFNCLERLVPPQSRHCGEMEQTIGLVQELVNEICSSVPFLLGHEAPIVSEAQSVNPHTKQELSQDMAGQSPTAQLIRPDKKTHSKCVAVLGGLILVFALYTSYGVPCIPPMQRLWLKRRYNEVSKRDGVRQAEVVGKYGMPEDFDIRRPTMVDYVPPPFEPYTEEFLDDECFSGLDHELIPILPSVPVENILSSN